MRIVKLMVLCTPWGQMGEWWYSASHP